ncbi:MAG: acyltransferase family protein [Giesbergeria sp.]
MPSSTHPLSHPKYRADIDGLRSIAVLSVVAFHAAPDWIHGGFIGVDIFFVISGFLISTIIFNNLRTETFSLLEFYTRRVKRIFPALLVVLAASYAMGWFVLLADEFAQLGKHLGAGALFVSNLALWNEAGYFDTSAAAKPLLHLWSLGIEEQFYIVWPALLILAWKRKYNLFTLTLVFAAASFALNLYGIHKNPTATFYSPQTRFWELLCGGLLAWTSLHPHPTVAALKNKLDRGIHRALYRSEPTGDGRALGNIFALVGAALLTLGFLKIRAELGFPGKWAIIPVLGAVLIISAGPQAWFNRVVLSNRLAVWIGLISFPLYLWHWPLLSFAHLMEGGVPRADIRLGAVLLAIALAWLTYWLVERPIRFGKRNRLTVAVLCTLMGAIGALGWYTNSQDGLAFRLESKMDLELLGQTVEPLNTRLPDGSCEKLLDFSLGTGAVCLTNTSAPEVLFVGDSHAMALNSAAILGKVPIKSMLIGIHGCPPLMGYSVRDGLVNKGCNALPDEALKVLSRYPSIQTVVLDSRGPFYFSGYGYGIEGPSTYSVFSLDGSTATQAESFENGYSQFIKELLLRQKKVVFVIDAPELGEDPKGCLFTRPVSILKKSISNCDQDRTKVDERQSVYRKLVAKMQEDNPGVQVYDPINLFCDDARCYGLRDKKLLYWDDDHISIWASELALNDMRKRRLLP